jgi:hypothetical protein
MTSLYNMDFIYTCGLVFMGLFLVLGTTDGIYFHLIKYRLHTKDESLFEHRIHSTRGILLGICGALLFSNILTRDLVTGLVALSAVIVMDLALEIVDIYVEKESRATMGGISQTEMVLHVFASSFRMAGLVMLTIVASNREFSEMISLLGLAASAAAMLIGAMGFAPVKSGSKSGRLHPRRSSPLTGSGEALASGSSLPSTPR